MPKDSPLVEMALSDMRRLVADQKALAKQKAAAGMALIDEAGLLERTAEALATMIESKGGWDKVPVEQVSGALVLDDCKRPSLGDPVPEEKPLPAPPPTARAAREPRDCREPSPTDQPSNKIMDSVYRMVAGHDGEPLSIYQVAGKVSGSLQMIKLALRALANGGRILRQGPKRGPGVTYCSLPSGAPAALAPVANPEPAAAPWASILTALANAGPAGLMPTPLRDSAGMNVDTFKVLTDEMIGRRLIARVVAGGVRYVILEKGLAELAGLMSSNKGDKTP